MPKYAPEIVAAVGHRYMFSDDTLEEIAAIFNINERDITRMRAQEGWPPRYARIRRVPQIPPGYEAPAQTPPPSAPQAAPSPDCLRGSEPLATDEGAEGLCLAACAGGDTTELPPGGSLIDRLERLVEQELAAEERLRARSAASPRRHVDVQRCARALAALTQTVDMLTRLRGRVVPQPESQPDDDMPGDIDGFRNELARRIDAFVASRTDAGDCERAAAAGVADEVQ